MKGEYLEFNLSKLFDDDDEINNLTTEQLGKYVKEVIRGKTNLLSKYIRAGCDETVTRIPKNGSQ